MLKWKISIFLTVAFISNSVFANSNELAKCVNVNLRASALMADSGNLAAAKNFKSLAEQVTINGKMVYGTEKFNNELASTKNRINSITTDELVPMIPQCMKLINSIAG